MLLKKFYDKSSFLILVGKLTERRAIAFPERLLSWRFKEFRFSKSECIKALASISEYVELICSL